MFLIFNNEWHKYARKIILISRKFAKFDVESKLIRLFCFQNEQNWGKFIPKFHKCPVENLI